MIISSFLLLFFRFQIDKFNKELEENRDSFGNGPIAKRSVTDCLCCLIFIAAIVGFCGASAYGWSNGDPKKLLTAWDSDGNGCGYSDATKDYKYLYWPRPPSGSDLKKAIENLDYTAAIGLLKEGTCVRKCPSADKRMPVQCYQTRAMASDPLYDGCVYQIDEAWLREWGIDISSYTGSSNNAPGLTFDYRYNTENLYGFCVPNVDTSQVGALSDKLIDTFKALFEETVMEDKITSYIADIAYSWKVIAICSGSAILLGYIYLALIRCLGAFIVWLSIILLQIALIGGGAYVYIQHEEYPEQSDYRDWVKYAAYGIWGVAGLYMLCVCCCWNTIRIGIAVYQTTAQYVMNNLRIYLLPFFAYIFAGIWLAVWMVSAIFVFSVGEP